MEKRGYVWIAIGILIALFLMFNALQSTPYYDDLTKEKQETVHALAENITAGIDGDLDKLLAILQWENETLSLELPKGYDTHKADHDVLTIINQGYGWCYDRSYVFEILAQSLGFKVRHVALASEYGTHALSEVFVEGKWVLFETSRNRIYRDEKGVPLSMLELHRRPELVEESARAAYAQFVYGVNSFHGDFAPPRIPYPDMAVEQLYYNFGIIPYLPYRFWKVRIVLISLGAVLLLALGMWWLDRRGLLRIPLRRSR